MKQVMQESLILMTYSAFQLVQFQEQEQKKAEEAFNIQELVAKEHYLVQFKIKECITIRIIGSDQIE